MPKRQPHGPIEVTAIIERRGRWYVGTVAEVPGVNVQERTLREARAALREALDELAEIAPAQIFAPGRRVEHMTVTP